MNNIYKKGDKVRVICDLGAQSSYIGQILTVKSVNKKTALSECYYGFEEFNLPLREDRLELLKEFYEVYI